MDKPNDNLLSGFSMGNLEKPQDRFLQDMVAFSSIITIIHLSIGVIMVFTSLWYIWKAYCDTCKYGNYNEVQGRLTKSNVNKLDTLIRNGNSYPNYEIDVNYEYQIGGSTFTGSAVYANNNNSFTSARSAQEQLDNLRLDDDKVTVYVNPDDPRDAHLIYTSNGYYGGFTFLLLGIVYLIWQYFLYVNRNNTAVSAMVLLGLTGGNGDANAINHNINDVSLSDTQLVPQLADVPSHI